MEVTVKIRKNTSAGRRLLRDVAIHKEFVQVENPLPMGGTYTLDEAFEPLWNRLNEHYGTDLRKL